MTNLDSVLLNSGDINFANKGPYSQSYSFSSSHVWMWELDHKEGWLLKNWRFWTVVLEKTLESPIGQQGDQTNQSKRKSTLVLIGKINVEAPILRPPDAKSWLIGKDPEAGKEWQQEKGVTEVEMAGWHHWLNGHEFGQAQR